MRTLVTLAVVLALVPVRLAQEGAGRVSEFGRYEGYSEERFDEWVTTSRYLEMRDGVKLALDVTRPARDGVAVDEPFPALWTHSRYHRNPARLAGDPRIRSMVDVLPSLQRLVRHGYVVASVAVRGSGASFGRFEGLFSKAETRDAVEVIAWLAAQPWCDGNVGMYGGSYLGITQYMAASQAPAALKAIFPDVAAFDMYELLYPGGVFRRDMIRHWAGLTTMLDRDLSAPPVDGDADGAELARALAGHADNWDVLAGYSSAPFRDGKSELLEWSTHGPAPFLDAIRAAEVPAYHYNGWFDVFVQDAVLWYANYEGPQRLTIGPWAHAEQAGGERRRIEAAEQHRWFDRWLKGIENGVEDETPIHYALMVEPGEWEWVSAETWPVEGTETERFHLAAGPSGSVASVNDGLLAAQAPVEQAFDEYRVDPTTTTGSASRWDNAVGAAPAMAYSGLARNDEKCLTWTTPPLEEERIVVGHPLVRLFVSSSSGDADLHVLLEEVAADGDVRYVSEGVLRASQRRLAQAPWDNLGLPYQRCFAADAEPLPKDEPAEVLLDLLPTAFVFERGHRIRVTLMGADADNTEASPLVPATLLRVWRGAQASSSIELPVLR